MITLFCTQYTVMMIYYSLGYTRLLWLVSPKQHYNQSVALLASISISHRILIVQVLIAVAQLRKQIITSRQWWSVYPMQILYVSLLSSCTETSRMKSYMNDCISPNARFQRLADFQWFFLLAAELITLLVPYSGWKDVKIST